MTEIAHKSGCDGAGCSCGEIRLAEPSGWTEDTRNRLKAGVAGEWVAFEIQAVEDIAAALAEIDRLREKKRGAYEERARVVAALSKVFPSHLARHPDEDKDWDDDWRWIVCVHLPTGQATWHIHDSQEALFSHLQNAPNHWDGHTTEEKHQRLEALPKGGGGW